MNKRIYATLFFLCISLPTLLLHNAIGPFVPLLGARISYIIHFGTTPPSVDQLVPGFYMIGTQISLIVGISPDELIYYPIQLLASIFLFFILFRRLSRSTIVGLLGSLVLVVTASRGSQILYYEHGMGRVFLFGLWFSILLLFYDRSRRSALIATLFSAPLIYISYNNSARAFLLFGAIMMVLFLIRLFNIQLKRSVPVGLFIPVLGISAITIFWSRWFYNTFVPKLSSLAGPEAGIVLFTQMFFDNGGQDTVYSQIALAQPSEVVYLGIARYLILVSAAAIFSALIFKDVYEKKPINPEQVLVVSLLSGVGFYFAARLVFGSFEFAELLFPSLLALGVLFTRAEERTQRQMFYGMFVVIIVLSTIGTMILASNGLVERDRGQYEYMDKPAIWWDNYGDGTATTDVRTKHEFGSTIAESRMSDGDRVDVNSVIFNEFDDIRADGYPGYVLGYESGEPPAKNVVLNHRVSSIRLPGWASLQPWSEFNGAIESPKGYNSVYSSGSIEIQTKDNIRQGNRDINSVG